MVFELCFTKPSGKGAEKTPRGCPRVGETRKNRQDGVKLVLPHSVYQRSYILEFCNNSIEAMKRNKIE